MLKIFERHPYLTICVVAAVIVSSVMQIIIGNVLSCMIREAENMASTENKQLKQFKLKFVNCYKLNEGMSNVPVFVERFLEKLMIGKMKLATMHRISGQLILFSVFLAGIGAARGIINGETPGEILPFYILSFLGLYVYFVSTSFSGMDEKKLSLKFSLVDYLENHMVGRMKQTEEALNQKLTKEDTKEKEKIRESFFTEKDKQELEHLLREFLT